MAMSRQQMTALNSVGETIRSEMVTKSLQVLRKSESCQTYQNKSTQKEMTYFNIVAAEGDTIIRLRVYQRTKFNMVKEGMSYKFTNMIKKGDNEYWVTSKSFIAYSSIVESNVPPDSIPQLPENLPAEGEQKTLASALRSPEKSTISGKIVAVSPVHYRQEGTLAVRALLVKDTSTVAKVCLFGNNAEGQYSEGDCIKVSKCYPKKYLDKIQMTCSPGSTAEFIANDQTVDEIQVMEKDKEMAINDLDFNENLQEGQVQTLVLTDFTDVDLYRCCEEEACREKKFADGKCPVCGKTTTSKTSFRVQFLYQTDKEQDKKITLFKSTLEKIMKRDLHFDNQDELICAIIANLPLQIKGSISASRTLYNLQK